MNIVKIQDDLKNVPDNALVGYVQNPNGQVPSYLALSELQRRKQMRQKASGGDAPQGPQPSVAEQLVSEAMPPMSGVASLPAAGGVGSPEAFAAGGIVSFADGGGAYLDPLYRLSPLGTVFSGFKDLNDIATGPAANDIAEALRGVGRKIGEAESEYLKRASSVTGIPIPQLAAVQQAPQQPTDERQQKTADFLSKQAAQEIPYLQAQQIAQANADSLKQREAAGEFGVLGAGQTDTGSGRAPAVPGGATARVPTGIQALMAPQIEYSGIPESEMTPVGDSRASMEEYKALVGEDPYAAKAAERIAKMEAQRDKLSDQYPWMALAEAGFGMAAGASPFALQNAAVGGLRGVQALDRGRKEVTEMDEKIFNAEAKVAEARRQLELKAAEFGVNDSRTKDAARRVEKAQKYRDKLAVETQNKSFEFDAQKFNIEEARKLKEAEDLRKYRADSLAVERERNSLTKAATAQNKTVEAYNKARDNAQTYVDKMIAAGAVSVKDQAEYEQLITDQYLVELDNVGLSPISTISGFKFLGSKDKPKK